MVVQNAILKVEVPSEGYHFQIKMKNINVEGSRKLPHFF